MDDDWVVERFEEARPHLHRVARRVLGDDAQAQDAVQEAWLRLSRSDASDVANLRAWLTTVVSRVCLDMLRARTARREDPWERPDASERPVLDVGAPDPEGEAVRADAVGAALLVVLDTLKPAERLAFVLHDVFAVPFDEIATVLETSPAAARQVASRARRRVQGDSAEVAGAERDRARHREVVEAFLAASREGRFERLLELLHPDVVLRADAVAVASAAAHAGAPRLEPEMQGARAVAEAFSGRALGAQVALVDGEPGAAWAPGGELRAVFAVQVRAGQVVSVEVRLDPTSVSATRVELLA